MKQLAEDILAQIRAQQERELSNREREVIVLAHDQQKTTDSAVFLGREREVYKDLKSKTYKYVSRDIREETDGTCPSDPLGEDRSPEGFEGQEIGAMMSPPAITSSRSLSGITAQHQKTAKGIKVMLTFQHRDEAAQCAYVELTAELKRSNRISELKPYADDSDDFAAFYTMAKQAILDEEDVEHRRRICIGRLHERGKRAHWVADMLVIGYLTENQTLEDVVYYYGTEEYKIRMDHPMSARQQELYHSNGIYGELKRQRTAPTMATLKRKYFQ